MKTWLKNYGYLLLGAVFIINAFTILLIACVGCTHSKMNPANPQKLQQTRDTLSKQEVYNKIEFFINQYLLKGEYNYDSLNFYFSKLLPNDLFNDNDFKYLGGKLLEREYLLTRERGYVPPESFPVYNMSIVIQNVNSSQFVLNIITQLQRNKEKGYEEYSTTGKEFVCIDSVVLALDKIPKMREDSIHKICMDLVKRNKTGGCKW